MSKNISTLCGTLGGELHVSRLSTQAHCAHAREGRRSLSSLRRRHSPARAGGGREGVKGSHFALDGVKGSHFALDGGEGLTFRPGGRCRDGGGRADGGGTGRRVRGRPPPPARPETGAPVAHV